MPTDQQLEEIAHLLKGNDLDGALQQVEACAGSGRKSSEWWCLAGRLDAMQSQQLEAYEKFEKSIELDQDNTEALFQYAYALDLQGQDEEALALYEKCVQEPPMHVNALVNLAVLYEDAGDNDKAEACLMQVLEHHPNHTRAALFLKDVRSSKNMFYDEDQERRLEKQNAILDIPISDFELSVRSRNCLKKMNIFTLGDLLRTTEPELLSYKNFGETSLNEIKAMLTQKGLHLGQMLEEEKGGGGRDPLPDVSSNVDPTILAKTVNELELSVRSRKCLQRLGIATLGDLVSKSEHELLNSKNFGQTSLAEVRLRLVENGLSLRKENDSARFGL